MTKVINFRDRTGIDNEPGPVPDELLDNAKGHLREVLIFGIDKENDIYFSASHDRIADLNLAIDWIKNYILTARSL